MQSYGTLYGVLMDDTIRPSVPIMINIILCKYDFQFTKNSMKTFSRKIQKTKAKKKRTKLSIKYQIKEIKIRSSYVNIVN